MSKRIEAYNNALLEAAASGDDVIILPLLAVGADVNARDENGSTALLKAVTHGSYKVHGIVATTRS